MTYIKDGLVSIVTPYGNMEFVPVEDLAECLRLGCEVVCGFPA